MEPISTSKKVKSATTLFGNVAYRHLGGHTQEIKVEITRDGNFYFDDVFVDRTDVNMIREYLGLSKPLNFCKACWKVSDGAVEEGRRYIESLR